MGLLRFLLATAVVLNHAMSFGAPNSLLRHAMPANLAVQVFFVVSGFYMALVLDTTYRGQAGRFYLNRGLRLLPTYWAIAGIVALGLLVFHVDWPFARLIRGEASFGLIGTPLALFANVALLGQELFLLVPNGYQYLAVAPGWSLGMEASFYLLAPLLVRLTTRSLATLTVGLLIAHQAMPWAWSWKTEIAGVELVVNPWFYVMPLQLPFFLLGMLVYRWDKIYPAARRLLPMPAARAIIGVLVLTFGDAFAVIAPLLGQLLPPQIYALSTVGLAVTLPTLFHASKHSAFDRALGDLAYPLYLIHYPALQFIPGFAKLGIGPVIGVLAAVSLGLIYAIERPVEALRQWVRENRGAPEELRPAVASTES